MLTLAAVRSAVADGVPLLVGFGGGVNSMAALILLRNMGLKPDLITFADTAGEKPGTYAYFDLVAAWLKLVGFPPLTIVKKVSPRTGDDSLEEESLRRETLPSRAFGMSSCAMRWKIEPQEKFLNHWPPAVECWSRDVKPIKVLGYDGGEARRASISEDKKLRYWYPLFEAGVDREDCEALIRREGLPVPPKSACFFCPSSTKAEVLALSAEHPDLFARAVAMERRALGNDHHPLRDVKGLGRHWAWGELVEMSAAQLALQLDRPVESCMVCVDLEAP